MPSEQTSLFSSPSASFPQSSGDVMLLWDRFVRDPEDDADAITFEPIKNGFSFFLYGKKGFELILEDDAPSLRLPGRALSAVLHDGKHRSPDNLYKVDSLTSDQLLALCAYLKSCKKEIFRSLVSDTFACCNAYIQCSDAGHCLHETDRFYNGCYYRTNLEHGRIFYGKNKNA